MCTGGLFVGISEVLNHVNTEFRLCIRPNGIHEGCTSAEIDLEPDVSEALTGPVADLLELSVFLDSLSNIAGLEDEIDAVRAGTINHVRLHLDLEALVGTEGAVAQCMIGVLNCRGVLVLGAESTR